MTLNEMNYIQLHEQKRHNIAQEAETSLHNRETERLTLQQLDEAARHNLAVERNDAVRNAETIRHQQAQDTYNMFYLGEQRRHNQAMESVNEYDSTTKRLQMYDTSTNASAANAIAARRVDVDSTYNRQRIAVENRNTAVAERNAASREYEDKIERDKVLSQETRGWISTVGDVISGVTKIGGLKTSNAPKVTSTISDKDIYINGRSYADIKAEEARQNDRALKDTLAKAKGNGKVGNLYAE